MPLILIIEDEPQTRENLALILEMEGFNVLTAGDGREGIEAARRVRPDLILCDIMMAELDGYGVLRELRADPGTLTTPLIFLTAKGDRKDLRLGMELGADDYLSKPVGVDELLGAIRARLERRSETENALRGRVAFRPNFGSAAPLQTLGLTPREAEVLLWVAQGKSNSEIATILDLSEKTVKVHLGHVFEKLGTDNRNAATVRALEVLCRAAGPPG